MLRKFNKLFMSILTISALCTFVFAAFMMLQNLGPDQLLVNDTWVNQYRFEFSTILYTVLSSVAMFIAAKHFRN